MWLKLMVRNDAIGDHVELINMDLVRTIRSSLCS